MSNKCIEMSFDPVSLCGILHQRIVDRTRKCVRQLKVTSGGDEIWISGVVPDFYHYQLAIAAVSSVSTINACSVRFDIKVD